MKKKLLFIVLLTLTVCTGRSQDITVKVLPDTIDTRPICFPFWMAKAIALDLEEKKWLEREVQLLILEKEILEHLVSGLEQKDQGRRLQLELMEKNLNLLEVQLRAEVETDKGDDWILWTLRLLGALGTGFILGQF